MEKKYHGMIPPIITPVLPNEDVDVDGFKQLLDYCINEGLQGLFIAGSNGETMALTQKERDHAIKVAIDHVNGRVPLMCGVMDTSTRRVIDNIKALEDMGGECAVVTPIFYDRHTSQDETIRHFERILNETDIDVMIYNIPPFTGLKLNADTMLKISALSPKVVGCKDSSGSFPDFITMLETYRDNPNYSVLQGVTAQGMASMALGADGVVPAMATCFPGMFSRAYVAGRGNDLAKIREYNYAIRETSKILGMSKNATAAAKYAISLRGFTRKEVIAPQDVTLPVDEEKIKAKVAEIDRYIEEKGL